MKKIVFIIPYFGVWPEWMRLFLVSCEFNPSVDWVLISDADLPITPPENVRLEKTTWESYKRLVSEKLSIDFNPASAYKLCDIKPSLAVIHPEIVEGYDYWAFGDVDVIYGDIRRFYTDEFLRYGLISTHPDGISGHLCLLRNENRINNAFRRVLNWQKLLSDDEHKRFDEGAFRRIFMKGRSRFAWYRDFRTRLDWYCRNAHFFEAYSTVWGYLLDSEVVRPPERWLWQEGHLFDADNKSRELMYLHFMNWKSNRYLRINGHRGVAAWSGLKTLVNVSEENLRDCWLIGREGFFDYEPTQSMVLCAQ